ncbi:MAG: PQQ-like beta-propeller repeat protein, partial [Cyclobacteriaceae bacterium]|nr:PQQ-like beta-propeller repeat protein [Cyclobacteriaceae bacterium]
MKKIEQSRLSGLYRNGLRISLANFSFVNLPSISFHSLINLISISHQSLSKYHKYAIWIFACFILAFGNVTGQSNNEWTIFRGDPSLSGTSKARIKTPLELKWTYQTDDAIIAAPVIGDNTIYVSSSSGTVYAIDLLGNLIWQFETDNSIEAPALYLNGKIFIGNLSGFLYALDAKSGQLLWTYEAENQISGSANYFYRNKKPYL